MAEGLRLELVPMRQLSEALYDDDDWTGMKDPAERRKRQIRLSLRAYRASSRQGQGKRRAARNDIQMSNPKMKTEPEKESPPQIRHNTHTQQYYPVIRAVPNLFIPAAIDQRGSFIPMRKLYPISRDHLIPLIEYNVWRANLTNALILGHVHLIGQRTCSFGQRATIFPNPYQGDKLPECLQPTLLQRTQQHPDWIDIFPSPRMRDNAVRAHHLISREELCADMLGRMSGGQYNTEPAIMVWSNPWEPAGWELSEAFIRKWWLLFNGCDDLFEATNRWRSLRGDDPLAI